MLLPAHCSTALTGHRCARPMPDHAGVAAGSGERAEFLKFPDPGPSRSGVSALQPQEAIVVFGPMKTVLRVTALFVALLTTALWFFGGLNLGRTLTTVPVEHPGEHQDKVIVHETRFLPGLDFLGIGLGASVLLILASCAGREPRIPSPSRT